MKIELVPDWRLWHRWWSTWLAAASAALQGAAVGYASLPNRWQALVPDDFGYVCAVAGIVCAGLIPIARILQQQCLHEGSDDATDSS